MWLFYFFSGLLTAAAVTGILMPVMKSMPAPAAEDKRLAVFLVMFIPFLTLVLYLALGRPDLPGSPRIFSGLMKMQEVNIAKASGKEGGK